MEPRSRRNIRYEYQHELPLEVGPNNYALPYLGSLSAAISFVRMTNEDFKFLKEKEENSLLYLTDPILIKILEIGLQ